MAPWHSPWVCIADKPVAELLCIHYYENTDGSCWLDDNPNYNCEYRKINLYEEIRQAIPKKGGV